MRGPQFEQGLQRHLSFSKIEPVFVYPGPLEENGIGNVLAFPPIVQKFADQVSYLRSRRRAGRRVCRTLNFQLRRE